MAQKFASKISARQMELARSFERAGLTSISQAVKAFERGDDAQIEEWEEELAATGQNK